MFSKVEQLQIPVTAVRLGMALAKAGDKAQARREAETSLEASAN